MVLKIRHLVWFYKKFKKDIWGIALTIVNFKFQPEKPTLFDRVVTELKRLKEKNKAFKLNVKKFVEYFTKKFSKVPSIKPSSKQNTEYLWNIRSKKLTKIVIFLKKVWRWLPTTKRRNKSYTKQKRKWKPQFNYTLDPVKNMKKKKGMKKRFASLRLTKAFFITFSYKQFRRLARSMRRKKGAYEHNYLLSLECRLMSYLYRTSLLTNPFYCIKFIQRGNVLIDLKSEKHYNYKVPIYKMITFSDEGKKTLYKTVKARLRTKKSYFNLPRFINMSYFFLFNYIIKPPVKGDLVYPIPMDFYRATGYAF